MDDEPGSETQSFIVRVWKESVGERSQGYEWRGSIVHVGSGKRLFFRDMARVRQFIEDQTGMGRKSLGAWMKKLFGKPM
jgi:hypothetical protein